MAAEEGLKMMKLSLQTFNRAGRQLRETARDLVRAIFEYNFHNGDSFRVVEVLKHYQNDDGGFGNGIESDFRLPDPSPMATSVGIRLLSGIEGTCEIEELLVTAIGYLESTFDEQRTGWFALNREVNKYPHASWWHYDPDKKMTIIDKNWGNPSAELTAYLYKYRNNVKKTALSELIEHAVSCLENKQEFTSANEIFCYIKLYEVLPERFKGRRAGSINTQSPPEIK